MEIEKTEQVNIRETVLIPEIYQGLLLVIFGAIVGITLFLQLKAWMGITSFDNGYEVGQIMCLTNRADYRPSRDNEGKAIWIKVDRQQENFVTTRYVIFSLESMFSDEDVYQLRYGKRVRR